MEEFPEDATNDPNDESEHQARKRILRAMLDMFPDLRAELVHEGLFAHLFERRLHRPLDETEHDTLRTRLRTLGPNRLGDVVLDLTPEALAAWLADPAAT